MTRTTVAIFLFLLAGCYSEKKANQQHGRAVSTFPQIGAQYCAFAYPVKEIVKPGKDSIVTDTIFAGPDPVFDTVTIVKNDTVYHFIPIQQPPRIITKKIFRTDTIVIENKAATAAQGMTIAALSRTVEKIQADAKKWEAKARQRFWLLVGAGSLFLILAFLRIRKKVKP